jgi:hypothetical protein
MLRPGMSGVPRERAAISKLDGADVEAVWAVADVVNAHKPNNATTIRVLISSLPRASRDALGKA